MIRNTITFVLISFLIVSCNKKSISTPATITDFDSIPVVQTVVPTIEEGSGIADSKVNKGSIWVEQDSGNPPEIYLLEYSGKIAKKMYIKNATNRDWEDMALCGNDLYVADIGDNNQSFDTYAFYKFPEPSSAIDTITNPEIIRFKYPDGAHDAEAFIVDPVSKDIYIITKRDDLSKVYKLAFPYSESIVSHVGTLTYSGVTSAAISPDGKEIIIKTYTNLYYYKRKEGQSIEKALQNSYSFLPYKVEPQGEAVTFANDNSGFFTLSEKGFSNNVLLYFYKRK
jgi:hypothetical protein